MKTMRITSSSSATKSFHILTSSSPIPRSRTVSSIHGIEFPGSSGDRNLPNLVSIRRNPVLPVASSESPVEAGIEIEDDETLKQLKNLDEIRMVHVRLELRRECRFGEQFLASGDHPVLGSWSPLEAAPMEWTDGHVWTTELDLPVDELIQFKFILRGITGEILWQPGPNRVFETRETSKITVVFGDWEKEAVQHISEERKDEIQDEESDELIARDDPDASNVNHLSHVESCIDDIASFKGQEMPAVVESITEHALQDSGCLREEAKVERKAEVFSIGQVVAKNFSSHAVNKEVIVSNTALKRSEAILEMAPEIPVLVPGLTPCLITPTEDAIAENCEPEIQSRLYFVQEEVEGYQENEEEEEEASTEVMFDKGNVQNQLDPSKEKDVERYRGNEEEAVIAGLMLKTEHSDKGGFVSRNELVEERQLTIYVGQDSRNKIFHNYIRQGQETLKRFLNKLGFQ